MSKPFNRQESPMICGLQTTEPVSHLSLSTWLTVLLLISVAQAMLSELRCPDKTMGCSLTALGMCRRSIQKTNWLELQWLSSAHCLSHSKSKHKKYVVHEHKWLYHFLVLRCECVINEKSHTPNEIEAQWYKVINARLIEDKIIATEVKRGKTSVNLVKYTWDKALQKCIPLPCNWVHIREVLVGRGVPCPT